MKLEGFEQPQTVGQNSPDREERLPQKPEPREERSPAELAAEKIQSTEGKAEELAAEGQRRLDSIEQDIGLPAEDIAAVQQETGISKKLGEIRDAMRALVVKFRQKTNELLARKQNKESQEIAEGTTTKQYLEGFEGLELEGNPGIKDQIRKNIIQSEKRNERSYEFAAAGLGISTEEFKARLQTKVEDMVGRAEFFRATDLYVLERAMNVDGRWKSQFETGTSNVILSTQFRAAQEMKMFGFNRKRKIFGLNKTEDIAADTAASEYSSGKKKFPKEVLEKDKEKRPIYGYFSDDVHGAINAGGKIPPPTNVVPYGAINFKIKKERALKKATITFYDTLQRDALPWDALRSDSGSDWPPTPASKPHFSSFRINDYSIGGFLDEVRGPSVVNWGEQYTEVQYHGGLTMDDMESIHISTGNGLSQEDIEEVRRIFHKYKEQHPESTIQLIEF